MTPWQHDAAMIHLRGKLGSLVKSRHTGPLNQRPAASRTPVRVVFLFQNCMTLAANAFHISKTNASPVKLDTCTHQFAWSQLTWMAR
jgi:hypothetical protein